MKITIEFDPTTAQIKVAPIVSVAEEAATQAVAVPAAQGKAMDAGACLGVAVEEVPSTVTPQAISAGIATAAGSAPPTPHFGTLALPSEGSRGEEGLDAGSAMASARP